MLQAYTIYTGASNIKHKVQSRTLRASHPDSYYVACFFKMMKRLGVVAAQVISKFTEDDSEPAHVVFTLWTIRRRSMSESLILPWVLVGGADAT